MELICDKAGESIELEKKLLILVSTPEAGKYIDALLWRKPEESFIPHIFTQSKTNEWIAITMSQSNINQASCAINLQLEPVGFSQQFEEVIELYDETTPEKLKSSQQRMDHYKSQNLEIIFP